MPTPYTWRFWPDWPRMGPRHKGFFKAPWVILKCSKVENHDAGKSHREKIGGWEREKPPFRKCPGNIKGERQEWASNWEQLGQATRKCWVWDGSKDQPSVSCLGFKDLKWLGGQGSPHLPKTWYQSRDLSGNPFNKMCYFVLFFSEELITRNTRQRPVTSHKQIINLEIMYQKKNDKIYPWAKLNVFL